MKKKRVLASLMCGLMLIPSNSLVAFASTSETPATFTATAEMLGGDLVINIPDSLSLSKDGNNFVGTGTVSAQGVTNPTAVLSVSTNTTLAYVNQSDTSIKANASVSFGTDGTAQWTASELKANVDAADKKSFQVTATVPMSEIEYIGEYASNIVFNISLSKSDTATTYYMGYDYTDSTSVSYDNQTDVPYDILPQADTVAELKEFSTDKDAIEAKGYDKVIESSDSSLVIPATVDDNEVVGVSFNTFFADDSIATYVSDVEVPNSVTGVELTTASNSASTTIITCENVRTAVNLSKKLPSEAKIRFKFESNGERDYKEFFTYSYDSNNDGYKVTGYSAYGLEQLKNYGGDTTVSITLPVTATTDNRGTKSVVGLGMVGYDDNISGSLVDTDVPMQEWIIPDSYIYCNGFWNNSSFKESHPCTRLKKVTFGSSLTSIYTDAFRYCTGLEELVIPASVTNIGSYAFYGCTNLSSVTFADGFNGSMGDNAFVNTGLETVTLPSSLTEINGRAFDTDSDADGNAGVKKFTWNVIHNSITVKNSWDIHCTIFDFSDGRYVGAGSSATVATATSDDGINAVISSNVADSAFYNNEGKAYSTITITEGVTAIGNNAFRKSTAQTITLPSTITSIGSDAFNQCSANFDTLDLRNVSVGETAFYDASITKCTVTASQVNDRVSTGATITNLYIDYSTPAKLGGYRFNEGTVTNVYFSGSEADWTTFMNGYEDTNGVLVNANVTYNATMQ